MRVDHQGLSLHYFHVYAVQDRISFQHLSNMPRLVTVEDIDVKSFYLVCIKAQLQNLDETHTGTPFACTLSHYSCQPAYYT
jgi:hypothetical protein